MKLGRWLILLSMITLSGQLAAAPTEVDELAEELDTEAPRETSKKAFQFFMSILLESPQEIKVQAAVTGLGDLFKKDATLFQEALDMIKKNLNDFKNDGRKKSLAQERSLLSLGRIYSAFHSQFSENADKLVVSNTAAERVYKVLMTNLERFAFDDGNEAAGNTLLNDEKGFSDDSVTLRGEIATMANNRATLVVRVLEALTEMSILNPKFMRGKLADIQKLKLDDNFFHKDAELVKEGITMLTMDEVELDAKRKLMHEFYREKIGNELNRRLDSRSHRIFDLFHRAFMSLARVEKMSGQKIRHPMHRWLELDANKELYTEYLNERNAINGLGPQSDFFAINKDASTLRGRSYLEAPANATRSTDISINNFVWLRETMTIDALKRYSERAR